MTIIEEAMLLSAAFVVLFVVLIIQSVTLARWYRAPSYYCHAAGWLLIGGQRLWRFYQIPSQWMRLRDQGWTPPDNLPGEEWIAAGVIILALLLFIFGYDRKRAALENL